MKGKKYKFCRKKQKQSLTCVSQTQEAMLLRGYSDGGGSHCVFEIFPEVKQSIEAK